MFDGLRTTRIFRAALALPVLAAIVVLVQPTSLFTLNHFRSARRLKLSAIRSCFSPPAQPPIRSESPRSPAIEGEPVRHGGRDTSLPESSHPHRPVSSPPKSPGQPPTTYRRLRC